MVRLTVSIVNFNGGEYLLKCLQSLKEIEDKVLMEVWIVDNASWDSSFLEAKKRFPKFHYIKNDENLGFGKAQNIVLKQLKTEYVLMLNPDTLVNSKALLFMLEFMDKNEDVGAATCKILKIDGSTDLAAHRGFPTPWASFLYYALGNDSLYHMTYQDMTKTHEVGAISGAFFLTRKKVLDKVGFFDEDYFLYAEDIDLCFRIKQFGLKIFFVPEVNIIHYHGVTSGIKKHSQEITTATFKSRARALDSFYQTMAIFYKKHFEQKYPFFINWLVYLGINIRWKMAKRSFSV